jgi:hypothetical protein
MEEGAIDLMELIVACCGSEVLGFRLRGRESSLSCHERCFGAAYPPQIRLLLMQRIQSGFSSSHLTLLFLQNLLDNDALRKSSMTKKWSYILACGATPFRFKGGRPGEAFFPELSVRSIIHTSYDVQFSYTTRFIWIATVGVDRVQYF